MARITDWDQVTREDVLKAIKRFDEEKPAYNSARSSFLVYNGKRYPAKHLRGMAYQEATGIMPSMDDFHGGDDTLNFFQKLGFETINEFSGVSSLIENPTIVEQFRECLRTVEPGTQFSSSQLRNLVVSKYNSNPASVLPQDYCYDNRHKGSNKVCFFLNPSRDLYIYVGENYEYISTSEIEKYIEQIVNKYGATIVPEDSKPDIHNIDYEGQHRLRYKTGGEKGQFRIGIRPENASKLSQNPDTTISYHYFSQEYYINDLSENTKSLIENLIRVSLGMAPLQEGAKCNYHLFKGTSKFKTVENLDTFGFTYWLIKNKSGTYKCNVNDVVYIYSTENKTVYRTIIKAVNVPGTAMQHAIITREDGSLYTDEDIMAQLSLNGKNQGANLSDIGVELVSKAKFQNVRVHLDPDIEEEKEFINKLESFFNEHLVPMDNYEPPIGRYNPDITTNLWLDILDNPEVTTYQNLQMLKMMLELGGECSCSDLTHEFGNDPPYYRNLGSYFGEKVSKAYGIQIYHDERGNWPFAIPFLGKKSINGHYNWRLRDELKEALENMDLSVIETERIQRKSTYDKNIILYGPPGTGKTFNTALYAVAICDGKNIEEVKTEKYEDVINRYNILKNEGRISFTTFHQSYGYEEFIEGIKPVMDSENETTDNDEISYRIEPGVFKEFCDRAIRPKLKKELDIGIGNTPNIWKVSLEGTGDNPTRTECLNNGHIRIGWDDYGESIELDSIPSGKKVLNSFINIMKKGDIVLSCYTQSTIDAIGIVKGDYEWHPEYDNFKRLRKVDWIVKDINEDITDINNGKVMTLSTVYRMSISLQDCIELIRKNIPSKDVSVSENYVFIIDEINRGNISKIFGELITLIEDTKRKGLLEEASVTLPYSKKPFSVPNNVYIIGTMNTADRSIALIDTALRRRFKFIEMEPDSKVLIKESCDKVNVNGIELNVVKMLEIINNRIEYLYDREHTIGHAFFLKLKGHNRDIKKLAEIFEGSIIPLLQEYFYEDYSKIAIILGDNGKEPELQFIQKSEIKPNNVFNGDIGEIDLPEYSYKINSSAFRNIMSYKGIAKDL